MFVFVSCLLIDVLCVGARCLFRCLLRVARNALVDGRCLMVVACCMLFVVCCSLFVVRCLLFVVRRVLFVDRFSLLIGVGC